MKKVYTLAAIFLLSLSVNAEIIFSEFTTNLSDQSIRVELDDETSMATITMKGPSDKYFAFGFGGTNMAGTYSFICNSTAGDVEERKLGNHTPGTVLTPSITVESSTEEDGIKTLVVKRSLVATDADYFDFSSLEDQNELSIIFGQGANTNFAYHGGSSRGTANVTFDVLDDITGITSAKKLNLSVFPNPTENNVRIEFDQSFDDTEVKIYSQQYQIIKEEHVANTSSVVVSLSDLDAGTYIISVKNSTYSFMDYVIKL